MLGGRDIFRQEKTELMKSHSMKQHDVQRRLVGQDINTTGPITVWWLAWGSNYSGSIRDWVASEKQFFQVGRQ